MSVDAAYTTTRFPRWSSDRQRSCSARCLPSIAFNVTRIAET